MELDELKSAWAEMGLRLEQQDLRLARLQRQSTLDGVRSRLHLLTAGQVAQLLIGLLFTLWAGRYWVAHLAEPQLLVYGVAVHLYGLALLIAAAVQLVQLMTIRYGAPVAEVQQQFLQLKRQRILAERVLLLIGAVVWLPILLILAQRFGFDVWATQPHIVLWNLAIALAVAGATAWAMYRYPGWLERFAIGGQLREAEQQLAELQDFRDA
jgi:hypothetical protein